MTYTVHYKVTGSERKRLVNAIARVTELKPSYAGVPTFAYHIGGYHVDVEGTMTFDDAFANQFLDTVEDALTHDGFIPDADDVLPTIDATADEAEGGSAVGLTVAVPLDKVKVGNLTALLDAKGSLIKKALGITTTPIEITDEAVEFAWFDGGLSPEEVDAYSRFIAALCKMSSEQKRITSKEKPVDNEKYAFRCFLLRLGFIGDEYKACRKILLRNLSGSSAFKSGQRNAAASEEVPA